MLWADLGRVPYQATVGCLHRGLVTARREKTLPDDVVLFQEFEPVITCGSRGGGENLLVSQEFLTQHGIDVVRADRGGNATYHGPGQLVVTPILDLGQHSLGLHAYIALLEEVTIRTLQELGVGARRHPEHAGVWAPGGKIAAIGVGVRRRVVFHGVSINVDPCLEHFSYLVPCGLKEENVTALANLLEDAPPLAVVRDGFLGHWGKALGAELTQVKPRDLESMLGGG